MQVKIEFFHLFMQKSAILFVILWREIDNSLNIQ